MPALRSRFLLAAAGVLAASGALADAPGTRTVAMPFGDCVSIIAETAGETGEEPVSLVRTSDILTVRIDAADGFVTVSCSRPDNKMTLTKAAATVTAGLAKTP